MFFRIDGYFKDDKNDVFNGMVVSTFDSYTDDDEDVFYFGLSRGTAENLIDKETQEDFVITRVYDY